MASLKLVLPLLLFSILSTAAQPSPSPLLPPPPPSTTSSSLCDAAETLANSGYIAMSLTLQAISQRLPLSSSAVTPLTIFSPPDSSFASYGQPSLPHLLLHFSPVSLSPSALLSFPFSTPIPSLSHSKHLIVTSIQSLKISINNVPVSSLPLLDDGFLLVYAIDSFFDPNFTLPFSIPSRFNPRPQFLRCTKLEPLSRFREAAGVLKSRGRSIMASFLELQLLGFLDDRGGDDWTLFAPPDQELVEFSGDFLEYSSLLARHVAPCKVRWLDLEGSDGSTAPILNVKGYALNVGKDDEMLTVNGVQISFPDMYESGRLVIHGISGVIALPELDAEEEELGEEFPEQET
ncbi:putative fasciclin-like arabinogalactan protein 20 [Salvia splendens]|uniref:putative fasciclin-like arabinogalactan protein 20 n=1 Tax=Salvia splendens TaxID=180675 RepID=UPI001C27CCB2|nr:putative fasciclin-like arabinogalactan protein 20 [Salvia splendens]